MTRTKTLRRYPRLVAHVIAESLGYATPGTAAQIVADARERKPNFCEWIYSCYGGDALRAIKGAIRNRHRHQGYMASYRQALGLVHETIKTNREPIFASWF